MLDEENDIEEDKDLDDEANISDMLDEEIPVGYTT